MKKLLISIVFSVLVIMAASAAFAETVTLEEADFPVVINGQNFTGIDSEYPIYVYNGVVYFPLAYDYAGFLGLRTKWFDQPRWVYADVLFIGAANEKTLVEPKIVPRSSKKPAVVTAESALPYKIALNTTEISEFYDNSAYDYPFLNVGGVTYLPFSWQIAWQEFGWEYSFSTENGLVVDTSTMFCPYIFCDPIGYTLPVANSLNYIRSENYYVVFSETEMDPDKPYELRVCRRGEKEKVIAVELPRNEYMYRPSDYRYAGENERFAYIDGNIFYVVYGIDGYPYPRCRKLEINLDTGELVNFTDIDNPLNQA